MNQIRFFTGIAMALPWFPLMIMQGKQLRKTLHFPGEPTDTLGEYGHSGQKFHILFMGESSVAGVGASSHANGLVGALARELADQYEWQVAWEVVARSGYTAQRVHQKLVPRIKTRQADLIVIGLGANDAFSWRSPLSWKKDITKLLDQLRQRFPETPILFMHLPPLRFFPALPPIIKKTAAFNLELLGNELAQLVGQRQETWFCGQSDEFIHWLSQTGNPENVSEFFSDGIHPSEKTYRQWGLMLARYIIDQQLIKISQPAS